MINVVTDHRWHRNARKNSSISIDYLKSELLQLRKHTELYITFLDIRVSTVDFLDYVKHLSLLAHGVRKWGSGHTPSRLQWKILSHVFPWQWGHVVSLTQATGLKSVLFLLMGSLGGSVEPERWREQRTGGLKSMCALLLGLACKT